MNLRSYIRIIAHELCRLKGVLARRGSCGPTGQDGHITREHVIWAYRILLDREAESEIVIWDKLNAWTTTQELRAHFMASQEFRMKNPKVFPLVIDQGRVGPGCDAATGQGVRGFPLLPRDLTFAVKEIDGHYVVQDADGVAIPPGDLIEVVGGSPDVLWYLRGGSLAAQSIVDTLERRRLSLDGFGSVLDFGCGCARVIRHWRDLENARLFGTDYNQALIDWCIENIDFAQFSVNGARPPLPYDDAAFDFIYALSVFTHLPEAAQVAWMKELARVLRVGGFLLITTHGKHYLKEMTRSERHRFLRGQLVVRNPDRAGTNLCGAFHPDQYVRDTLAEGFAVLDFIPEGAKGNPYQDILVLQKAP